MGFVEAIKSGFSNYVNFHGRARRSAFWFWVLFVFLVSVVLGVIDAALFGYTPGQPGSVGMLGMLWSLAVLLPGLAVAVRRLHDTGRSGFWLFIGLVPIIGWIVLVIFYVMDSQPGANKHGPSPKEGSAAPAETAPTPTPGM